jgi:hypothetical protein
MREFVLLRHADWSTHWRKGPVTGRKLSRFYFHCSDGVDLVLDREGVEIEASDVLLSALRVAARLVSALPSYDDWPAWTVSVHDELGSLVETLPFPANTDRRDALHYEEGIERWVSHSPPHPHQTGSRRYH